MEQNVILYVLIALVAILVGIAVKQQQLKVRLQTDVKFYKKELEECKLGRDRVGNSLRIKISELEKQLNVVKKHNLFKEYLLLYLKKNWNKALEINIEDAYNFALRLSYNTEKEEYEVFRYGKNSKDVLTNEVKFYIPISGDKYLHLERILENIDLDKIPNIVETRELINNI